MERCACSCCGACTAYNLQFTDAARKCSVLGQGVRKYRKAAAKGDDPALWLAAYEAFEPLCYHTVYQRAVGQYVESESEDED